jgi:hypothetical protein
LRAGEEEAGEEERGQEEDVCEKHGMSSAECVALTKQELGAAPDLAAYPGGRLLLELEAKGLATVVFWGQVSLVLCIYIEHSIRYALYSIHYRVCTTYTAYAIEYALHSIHYRVCTTQHTL